MQIEIASIGNELLLGITVDQNAVFLSRELSQRGYRVARHVTLPDEKEVIQTGVKEALARSSLLIVVGGLGPTLDDVTESAVRSLFPEEPLRLKNEIGTALGAFYSAFGKGVFLLPGVPREMEPMFLHQALPLLERHFPFVQKEFIHSFSLCLFKEKEIDLFLRDLKEEHPEISCGIYPSQGTLCIVLRSVRPLKEIAKKFEEKFPTYVFAEKKIEEAVHRTLIAQKRTLALAESCTGGAIAARLTAIPDASYFLLGSIVAYSNRWKEQFLAVSPTTLAQQGAVSRETVEEMLQALFADTDADFAIAVSGIAGPKGGTPQKPVGTIYIGIGKRGERSDIGKVQAPPHRASAIEFSVQTALCALWRRLVHNVPTFT